MREGEPYLHHEYVGKFQVSSCRSTARPGERCEQATVSAEELQDLMDQFTYIMHEKFLLGEDHEYLDYSKIDNDETLDDHWQREANHDAEEKYFNED
ncbi:hypothetical protein RchiOBHm_Chr4g0446321 [Rosa chinensis]|uniref:CCD97-like C-terminal domain-containing protein n=1 Tax=Rosa chinensis TaxID=74649 RepID=A0A2P6R4N5_ROSCH|nr:hypothetical protein RchiOBHm_Chr4g0446321 [Rosa chinensis]